jgi:acyl-coenzyme A synthetase/AMP-(fatty) acid ligase
LESILLEHELIDDASVIGIYVEQEATEYPVAYVALKQNVQQSDNLKEDIKDFIARRVSDHKKLRGGVLFIHQIPRHSSGKIRKNLLKDRIKTEHPLYTNSAPRNCNNSRFTKGKRLAKNFINLFRSGKFLRRSH